MKTNIQIFEFNGSQIEFDLTGNVMVNATEMAKIFGTEPKDFLRIESTKSYIKAWLSSANLPNSEVRKETDLFRKNHRTGTWMHRAFAIKFAAWLDPNFEVWVYDTIDKIMFGTLREDVKEKVNYETERDNLYNELIAGSPEFVRYVELDQKAKTAAGNIKKQMRTQLSMFKSE